MSQHAIRPKKDARDQGGGIKQNRMRKGNRFVESKTINSDQFEQMMDNQEICQPCGLLGGVNEDESEETNPIKAVRDVRLPSVAEIAEHNLTHLPFRDWCAFCVQGKAVSHPHQKRRSDEPEVPVITIDNMGLARREPEEGQAPIIVGVDRSTKI